MFQLIGLASGPNRPIKLEPLSLNSIRALAEVPAIRICQFHPNARLHSPFNSSSPFNSQFQLPGQKLKPLSKAITSAMIFQGNRLSHLRLPCFAFRQTEPFPLYAERVPISFNTLLGRYTSVSGNHGGYITRVSYRNYADRAVSRPKAHTGRTTTASSKKAATTTKVTVKPKTKTAKEKAKPKPKPGTKAKAKPRAKPKAKRKPISKRKTKAKAKPRPRKKILTEQQKEKLAANKARQNIRHLKATALDPPEQKKGKNVFTVVLSEISKEPDFAKAAIGPLSREAGARYKALSPERREVILGDL